MGMFSFLDKPFRTGRSKAARDAQKVSQNSQGQFQQFIDLLKPSIELGGQQLQEFSDMASPEGLDNVFQGLVGGDIFNTLSSERSRAAEQFAAKSGIRRGGAGIRQAADVPTDVLMGLLQQVMGSKQNAAQIGLGQGGNALGGLGGLLQSGQFGANAGRQSALDKADTIGAGVEGLGKLASFFIGSDERIKENIEKEGQFDNGIGIYSYNYVGTDERVIGVIAQEVEKVLPDAVKEFDGIKHVNYEAIQ